jgi:hypothetical protein
MERASHALRAHALRAHALRAAIVAAAPGKTGGEKPEDGDAATG